MYQEANGSPCNESPLGAAFAYQSLLLSSFDFRSPELRTSDVPAPFSDSEMNGIYHTIREL